MTGVQTCALPIWRTPSGYLHLAGLGPMLAWRAVRLHAMPTMSNWALEMGDIELM